MAQPPSPSASADHSPSPPPSTSSPYSQLRRAAFLTARGRPAAALTEATAARAAFEAAHGPDGLAPFLVQIGAAHFAQHSLAEAEVSLRRAVSLAPNDADALCGLAVILKARDPIHIEDCLNLFRRAREAALNRAKDTADDSGVAPVSAEDVSLQLAVLLTDVGIRLKMAGLPASAIEHYKDALDVCPTYSQALYNLAVAYTDAGEADKARECYEQCLHVNPSHVEAWCNLGVLHRNDGNGDLAVQAYERALSCNPNFDLAKKNLAIALSAKGTALKGTDRQAAKRLYQKAIALNPAYAEAHYDLGVWYAENGQLDRALVSYNMALQFNSKLTEAHNNLGVVYKELGNMEKALECYKEALQCDSQHHQTHNNIAVIYTIAGNLDAASQHLRLANSICPQYAEAHNNIGVLLRDQGDIDTAIWHYERSAELDSQSGLASQNRLHALNYSERWTKADVYQQHKAWGSHFQERIDKEIIDAATTAHVDNPIAAHLLRCLKNPPRPDPDQLRGPGTGRPLRIGYLSPDFYTHSVSYFAEVLLTHFDPEGFMVFAYSNVAQTDAKTERFRSLVGSNWRHIYGQTASDTAKIIVDDQIDILVELAGHTANNRLDIMALRLAPVQVTWIGYPNTTGLSSIHYRVTDGTVDPPSTTQLFTEKLWRLPDVFLCYTPALEAPADVSPPPSATSGGIITFGSFNVLSKTQARTIRLWAEILRRVPDSRLLLKAKTFGTVSGKKRMECLFEEEGIAADRLDLLPLLNSTKSHLQIYSNVDVALDPFPYAGTTTTCEALFMGVPVITLGVAPENGDHAHNVGVSLLSTIGHPELIAFTEEDYVGKAVNLGTNLTRLQEVRRNLRKDMMESPLGQKKKYIQNVEEMFCGMWVERGGRIADSSAQVTDAETNEMGDESVGSTTPQSRAVSESSDDGTDELPSPEDNAGVGIVVEEK